MTYPVYDVAQAILERIGSITTLKLQKLVYYCQAWSLVWDDRPITTSHFEAWANGPVSPSLFRRHQGDFLINERNNLRGNSSSLDDEAIETVEAIIRDYGDESSHFLKELTHQESPWKNARGGLPAGARSSEVITHAEMANYYSGL